MENKLVDQEANVVLLLVWYLVNIATAEIHVVQLLLPICNYQQFHFTRAKSL